jgi:protein phosphatase
LAKLAWALRSEPGEVRPHNEDYAGVHALTTPDDSWDRGPLFVVADGLGGHAAGEVASRLAVDAALQAWTTGAAGPPSQSLRAAARAAHVGDSRAYLVRGEECHQLTADHTRVGEMLRMKLLTPEQAAAHPARSQLTRALGGDVTVQVDLIRKPVAAQDTFVLCSDGLWDAVSRAEITAWAGAIGTEKVPTPAECADGLLSLALEREAPDNVTVVVIRVSSDRPIPAAGARRSLFRLGRG